MFREERKLVYLTYLDDGGKDPIKVFGGIVLDEQVFTVLEAASGAIAMDLVPPERRDNFEFHASDLFNGTNAFEDIDETSRHKALLELVQLPQLLQAPYVYSAIDIQSLQRGPARSASWIDMAFFMCACGVEAVIQQLNAAALKRVIESKRGIPGRSLNLMVIDEPEKAVDKGRIRASFRSMRAGVVQAMKPTGEPGSFTWSSRLSSSVDDLFFGHSSDSLGLQVADACNWAIWRQLRDNKADKFYQALSKCQIVCAKPEPEWTQFRHLFMTHESD